MDYPRENNWTREDVPLDFFTAGSGRKDPALSGTSPDDDLNSQNFFDNKEQATPAPQTIKEKYPDADPNPAHNRNLGRQAIPSPEQRRDPLAESPFKIVDLTPPPGAPSWSGAGGDTEAQQVPIRMRGGRLDPDSMKAIRRAEAELLSQFGNVTEFYDKIIDMRNNLQEAA